jgi:hypothetical protein
VQEGAASPGVPRRACRRCGRSFIPRQTGGKLQRYCSPGCRKSFDSWVRARGRTEIDTETATRPSGIGSEACATRALAQQRETPPPVIKKGVGDPVLSDAPVRFVVEVPASIIRALIFSFCYLRFDERHDLRAILAALERLGRKPSITHIC